MPGSTSKKVVVLRFDREPLNGYVSPGTYLQAAGVELLSATGSISIVPLGDVKAVCFVRDWDGGDALGGKRTFLARPRLEGLWVRMLYRDGEVLEGLLSNKLLDLDASGFVVIPPDASAPSQRVFVPRGALRDIQVLGVVGSPLRPPRKKRPPPEDQLKMFE